MSDPLQPSVPPPPENSLENYGQKDVGTKEKEKNEKVKEKQEAAQEQMNVVPPRFPIRLVSGEQYVVDLEPTPDRLMFINFPEISNAVPITKGHLL